MSKIKILILSLLFVGAFVFGETYSNKLNPTALTDDINFNDISDEFDEIERILKKLESANFENGSLLNEDIKDNTLESGTIKDATLTPADMANVDAILAGGMIYATDTGVLGVIGIGANNTQLKVSASGFPTWAAAPSLPFTDAATEVYAASTDDNITIGGSTNSNGKAVLSILNNTIPSASIANGIQVYTKDVYDTTTVLLLNLNGSDGAQTTTDSSSYNKTVTVSGNAQLDTAQKKYGVSSCLFDGTSDYLSLADSTDWDYGSGNFTIDFWYRPAALTSPVRHTFYWQYQNESNYTIIYMDDTKLYFTSYASGAAVADYNFAYSFSVDTWYHIAVVRSSTNFYIFVNGTSKTLTVTQAIGSATLPTLSAALEIGGTSNLGTYCVNGWLDDYRIVKGSALWTANFTPPASELALVYTSSLFVRDEAGNETQLSPHNYNLIPSDQLLTNYFPFTFYCENQNIGYVISVDMEGFIREVEKLSGKKFIYTKED